MRLTSIASYHDLVASGALNQKQRAVWGALHVNGPSTGRELDQQLATQDAHKRLSELERAGLVYELRKGTCKITGRKSIVWALTGKDPNGTTREDLRGPLVGQRPTAEQIRKAALELGAPGASKEAVLTAAWLRRIAK